MKTNNQFAERLQTALSENDMRPLELSRITGIDKAAISNYLNGKYKPKTDKLYLIANALRVNEAWLMGSDEVPMRKAPIKTDTIYHLSEDEVLLIEQFRKATFEQKRIVGYVLGLKAK